MSGLGVIELFILLICGVVLVVAVVVGAVVLLSRGRGSR